MNNKTVNMTKFYKNCNITKEELQQATDIVRAIAVNAEFLQIDNHYNSLKCTVKVMNELLKSQEEKK